jgi:hypothetical protein
MITTSERLALETEIYNKIADRLMSRLRVAEPGIIQSFDENKQTVSVKLSVRELVNDHGKQEWKDIPLLVDVPVKLQRGGGYMVTLPFAVGDECLVVFGDKDMDAWWQSGGVQNWGKKRRHSLSDGYALPGINSQARTVSGYSTDSVQLRNEDGDAYLEVKGNNINIIGETVTIIGRTVVTINPEE